MLPSKLRHFSRKAPNGGAYRLKAQLMRPSQTSEPLSVEKRLDRYPIWAAIIGFTTAIGIAGSIATFLYSFGVVKVRTVGDDQRQQAQITEYLNREREQRKQTDELFRQLLEAKQRALQLESDVQRDRQTSEQSRQLFAFQTARQQSEADLARADARIAVERLTQEANLRTSLERTLAEENRRRQQLETTFPTLEAQGLWAAGRPSPRAYLLVEGSQDVRYLREIFESASTAPLRKAQIIEALVSAKQQHQLCLKLEQEKLERAAEFIGSAVPISARAERIRHLGTRAQDCVREMQISYEVAGELADHSFSAPFVNQHFVRYDDPPSVPSGFASWLYSLVSWLQSRKEPLDTPLPGPASSTPVP